MSKFNFEVDSRGNVSGIKFPKTNLSVVVEYPEDVSEGEEVKPSGVSLAGQSMTIEQFSNIKIEKDEEGKLSVESSSEHKPWWWDFFFKNFGNLN